jgi:hypothetical protein
VLMVKFFISALTNESAESATAIKYVRILTNPGDLGVMEQTDGAHEELTIMSRQCQSLDVWCR